MLRNFVTKMFEALAWIIFFGIIILGFLTGPSNETVITVMNLLDISLMGDTAVIIARIIGGILGFVSAVLVMGLIFAVLDIRASNDKIANLLEHRH